MAFNLTPNAILGNAVLGFDLLTNGLNRDVVGIFNQDTLQQVFVEARPMEARVREISRVMDHPVETGVTLSDHHVILPRTIELSLTIKSEFYSSTYEQIRSSFINAILLSIQTKAGVYPNMIIQEIPHKEDPETFDLITLGLRMREVQFIAPASITQIQGSVNVGTEARNYAPADPINSNTANRGLQAPKMQSLENLQIQQPVLGTW